MNNTYAYKRYMHIKNLRKNKKGISMIDVYCGGKSLYVVADGEALGYIAEWTSEPIDDKHTKITITHPELIGRGPDIRYVQKTFRVRNDEVVIHRISWSEYCDGETDGKN